MSKRKIALLGGTFDPIHLGHTAVAAAASEYIGAEKTIFIPAKRSPLKKFPPSADDYGRLEMINLAIAGYKSFMHSDYELQKPGPGFTIHTVRFFQSSYGGGFSIYWLAGADNIEELPRWYKVDELIDECNMCLMYRAGCKPPDVSGFESVLGLSRIEKLRANIIETPLVDISSSRIRETFAAGGDASDMLHPDVAEYIHRKGLYKTVADQRP